MIDVIIAPRQHQHNFLGPKKAPTVVEIIFSGAYKKACLRHQDNHPASLTSFTSKQLSNP